jgi:NTE family protein
MDKQIQEELLAILGDDAVTYRIHPDYDIPLYTSNVSQQKRKKVLVLSGGGIKGIAHIGALKALEELGYLDGVEIFAGASVGALIIGLLVAGYTPDELNEFIDQFDANSVRSINFLGILDNFSLDDGVKIDYVVRNLLLVKKCDPDTTLADLYDKTGKKIVFSTLCLNTSTVEYISHDNYPNLPLYKAMRMSFSVPWLYSPIEYNKKLYIDGGCRDNYPISIFKDQLDEVLGVYLMDNTSFTEKIENIETFTFRVIECFMEGVNLYAMNGYEQQTVKVLLKPISLINFSVGKKHKNEMFSIGYNSMMSYFNP